MEDNTQSTESKLRSLAEIDFPTGPGPVPHQVRFLDPRHVEAHFAALEVKTRSPGNFGLKSAMPLPFPAFKEKEFEIPCDHPEKISTEK